MDWHIESAPIHTVPVGTQFEGEVYAKLLEAEHEASHTEKRYSSQEVLKAMREAIGAE
ncbi:MAG: hypothetical protein FWD72_02685 [Eggerthellaceae bacterium]|nr:hypothetical protein [Eggerthellaceae bacterium]